MNKGRERGCDGWGGPLWDAVGWLCNSWLGLSFFYLWNGALLFCTPKQKTFFSPAFELALYSYPYLQNPQVFFFFLLGPPFPRGSKQILQVVPFFFYNFFFLPNYISFPPSPRPPPGGVCAESLERACVCVCGPLCHLPEKLGKEAGGGVM